MILLSPEEDPEISQGVTLGWRGRGRKLECVGRKEAK